MGGAIAHFFNCLVGPETESDSAADATEETLPGAEKVEGPESPSKTPDANGKVSSAKKKNKKQQDKNAASSVPASVRRFILIVSQ